MLICTNGQLLAEQKVRGMRSARIRRQRLFSRSSYVLATPASLRALPADHPQKKLDMDPSDYRETTLQGSAH